MKKTLYIFIAISSIILLLSSSAWAVSGGVNWTSYEKGIELAEKQGKKVFVYFYTEWCGYCKKMNQTTFKDLNVIKYINDNFIPIIVNSDKEKKISAKYGVRGLPTLWFLKEDSESISNIPGYINAKKFLVILKYINTESNIKMSFQDFEKTI